MRWRRDIVRRRWAASSMHGKTGRPATRRNIKALVLRLARENSGRGYRRIHGELARLGVKVAASTVWEILRASGIDPAQRRTGPTWSEFLRSQADATLASDFFTADLRNQWHLMIVLREYEDSCNTHRPHRTLNQAAPLRPLPDGVTDLDQFRGQRRDRAGGVIHEYRLVAYVSGTHRCVQHGHCCCS